MQIKNLEVAGIVAALGDLIQVKMPLKTGLKLRKIARIVEQQAKDIEAERQKLLDEYAERDAEGARIVVEGAVKVDPEFFLKLDELLDLEFEVPEPILVSELTGAGDLAPAVLIGLGALLVE